MSQLQHAPPKSPNNSIRQQQHQQHSASSAAATTPSKSTTTTTTTAAAYHHQHQTNTATPTITTSATTIPHQHQYQGIINGAFFVPPTVPYHFPVGHPLRRLSLLSPDALIKFKIAFPQSFLKATAKSNHRLYSATRTASTSIFETVKNHDEGYSSQISKAEHPITPPLMSVNHNNNTSNNIQQQQLSQHHHVDPNSTISPSSNFGGLPASSIQQQQTSTASPQSGVVSNTSSCISSAQSMQSTVHLQYWMNELKRLLLHAPNRIESEEFIDSVVHHKNNTTAITTLPLFSKERDDAYFEFAVKKLSEITISSIQHWYLAARFTNDLDLMVRILESKTIDEALEYLKKQEKLSAKNRRQEIDGNLTLDELYDGKQDDDDDDEDENNLFQTNEEFSEKNCDLLFMMPSETNGNNNNNISKNKTDETQQTHHRRVFVERDNRWGSPCHRRRVFRFGLWCAFVGTGLLISYHDALKQHQENEQEKDDDEKLPPSYVPLHIQLLIETQGHPLYLRSKPIWNNRHEEEEGSFSSSWTAWYGEDLSLLRDFDISKLLPDAFCDEKFRVQNSPQPSVVTSSSTSSASGNVISYTNLGSFRSALPQQQQDKQGDSAGTPSSSTSSNANTNISSNTNNNSLHQHQQHQHHHFSPLLLPAIDDQIFTTRPLVTLPIVFLIASCESEDFPCTARIAEYLLPPPKLVAAKIRARLIEKQQNLAQHHQHQESGEGKDEHVQNNNNSNSHEQQQQQQLLQTVLMSDHLPSSLNLLQSLFRSSSIEKVKQQHASKVAITPSFIYSVLIDCYSSAAGDGALRVLLSTMGKRLIVLGADALLADGGHLEKIGFADTTSIDLMKLNTDEISKELQHRRSLVRGGNLLGRLLEIVRQDFSTKEQQQQQQQIDSSLSTPRQQHNSALSSSSSSSSIAAASTPAFSTSTSSSVAITFLAKAAPRITRRRLMHHKEAFSTKLLLRQHAFEFKLQNLSALTRPLEFWWTQQLGAFCGLKPSALSHQLATFARGLTDHEMEQEDEDNNNSAVNKNDSPSDNTTTTSTENTNEKNRLSLDMMIGAAASSSKGPVCCAFCVSVPVDEKLEEEKLSDDREEEEKLLSKMSEQEKEHARIKKRISRWEGILRSENCFQAIPSWCYECGVDDIVVISKNISSSTSTGNNRKSTTAGAGASGGGGMNTDLFVEKIPPSLASASPTADVPLSVAENSSYFSVSQTTQDNYNSTTQSQEFFLSKKMGEEYDVEMTNNNNNNNTPLFGGTTSNIADASSTAASSSGASPLKDDSPRSTRKFATFVYYVRFDSFADHALDQMNLDAHLFTFHIVKKNCLPLPSDPSSTPSLLIQNNVRARTLGNGVRLRVFFGQLSFQRIIDRLRSAKKLENALVCGLMTIPSEQEKDLQQKKKQKQQQHQQNQNHQNTNSLGSSNTPSSLASTTNSGSASTTNRSPTPSTSASPMLSRHNTKAGDLPGVDKMSKLLSFLYLGSANDASSPAILKEGITHVLNASNTRVFSPSHTLKTKFLGIHDVGDRSVFDIKTIFPVAFAFIDDIQKKHDDAMSALMSGGADVGGGSSTSTSSSPAVNNDESSRQGSSALNPSSTVPSLFTVTKATQPSSSSVNHSKGDKKNTSSIWDSATASSSTTKPDGSSSTVSQSSSSSSSSSTVIVPKILIHCEKGKSRSVAITAAYLMRLNGWTVGEALHFIRQRRPGVEPNLGFLESLKEFEREIEKEKALKRRALSVVLRNPAQSLSKEQILKAMQLLGSEEVVDCSDRIAPDGTRRLVTQFASPGGATRAITSARVLSSKMLALGGRVWLTDFDEVLHAFKTGRG